MSHPSNTRDQLLDTAERLFAEHGFDATSLRQLTSAAGANLAAVHYHFGSKESLLLAVFARRIEPINRARIERMTALAATHLDDPIPLEQLLFAFYEPALRVRDTPGGEAILRLFGRLHSEPLGSDVRGAFFAQFRTLRERMVPLFAKTLPHLDERELFWRLHFAIGALAHTMACGDGLALLSDGKCGDTGPDESLPRLVAFAAAGLRAPATRGAEEAHT